MALSAEEAAALVRRLSAAEEGLQKLGAALDSHRAEIIAQHERHAKLMHDLQAAFERQAADITSLRAEQEETRRALAAGAGGSAGLRLIDTRIMDKPTKFHGEQTEWKDWSEGLQAFCDAADEELGATMLRYSKSQETVFMSDVSPTERRQSKQLH